MSIFTACLGLHAYSLYFNLQINAPKGGGSIKDIATAPLGLVGKAAELAGNIFGDNGEKSCQDHLQEYVGRLMLAGSFQSVTDAPDIRQAAERSAHMLDVKGLLEDGNIMGIRPMIPVTQRDAPKHLTMTVSALGEACAEYGAVILADEEPIICGSPDTGCGPAEACRALDTALSEFEAQSDQLEPATRGVLGFVAVVNAGYAGHTMQGFHVADLNSGGMAELRRVGKRPSDNLWVAR